VFLSFFLEKWKRTRHKKMEFEFDLFLNFQVQLNAMMLLWKIELRMELENYPRAWLEARWVEVLYTNLSGPFLALFCPFSVPLVSACVAFLFFLFSLPRGVFLWIHLT